MALLGDIAPPIVSMEKETDIKKILHNADGQMTIFFATSVLVLITFIAFIVNIGIFVKAKINLQNAVDAAAYSGASVQARQLSNIAYLNWEMRNNYKEWMFKTYVLSNLSLPQVAGSSSNPVNFTMEPFSTGGQTVQDGYNVPSVCLDFSASGNVAVCKKALVPGLPRFDSTDVLGLEENLDAFVDALSEEKADNCALRSNVNFLTNFIWAYNVTGVESIDASDLSKDAPEVASERPGAFPAAFDLALRIRNLEAQVNKAPYQGVCIGNSPFCSQRLPDIINSNGGSPADERVYKAFQSGWRNIGGTDCDQEGADEFKCSFTLTELEPKTPNLGQDFSLSNLLIPSSRPEARQKRYLDLKLMPVNYATFYTMLAPVSTTGGINVDGLEAEATAECVATKVGMPVPGFPLGFVKNPDVLTYYAVKGEAQFNGLFNPFANNGVKLTAYAAAKPFGGRIGPMIFDVNSGGSNTTYLKPRNPPHYKSSPYVSALDNTNPVDRYGNAPESNEYQEGMPIPGNYGGLGGGFWLKDNESAVGGWIDSQNIHFAVPNIPYDYPTGSPENMSAYFADSAVQVIKPLPLGSNPSSKAGLYNSNIFEKLKSRLRNLTAGQPVKMQDIADGILLSRAPTTYDALNYLVPTPEDLNKSVATDSYGVILSDQAPRNIDGNQVYDMQLYAPLIEPNNPNALYKSVSDLVATLQDYTARQEPAVLKYRKSMNLASKLIYEKNYSSRTDANYGLRAAKSIADLGEESAYTKPANEVYENSLPTCKSINGKFVWFYTANPDHVNYDESCLPKNTLAATMEAYWNQMNGKANQTYYMGNFVLPAQGPKKELFSAYRPGGMNDAQQGVHKNFLLGNQTNMSRNFYSSKFTALQSLMSGASPETFGGNFAIFSEGARTNTGGGDAKADFKNYLLQQPGIDLSEIRH